MPEDPRAQYGHVDLDRVTVVVHPEKMLTGS
jgi:hypothetical protein